jgi:hypothetical protein
MHGDHTATNHFGTGADLLVNFLQAEAHWRAARGLRWNILSE